MNDLDLTITPANILTMMPRLSAHLIERVKRGNVAVKVSDEKRSGAQNRLLWAVLNDVSRHVVWHGRKIPQESWKHILSAAWRGQQTEIGINGELVVFGQPTSKLNKAQFSELIEVIYSFGAEHGVRWTDESMAVFEKYREAK